jgi:CBS domain-containing protein
MGIEQDLRRQPVSRLDLSGFVTVGIWTPVFEVLRLMREEHVNAALVEDDEGLAGIFTERDVLLKVADEPSMWKLPVGRVMTPSPQTVSPDTPIIEALRLMNAGHYRNLPVMDGAGKIVGNLSQYVIVHFLTDRFPLEIYNLPPDPELIPQTKEGA